jgi:CheY-like chemotaxis protein
MISSSEVLHGKILIVDDQQANVLLLERILRGAGYDSISSTLDAKKVCELNRMNHYDLILLDLEMPGAGFSGFQVMEGLKKIESLEELLESIPKHRFQVNEGLEEIEPGGYLPVMVITAHPEHKLRALKAGAKDFICRPFELNELLARVHNMLEVRLLHVKTQSYISALEHKVQEVESGRDRGNKFKRADDQSVPRQSDDIAVSARVHGYPAAKLRTMLLIEDNPVHMKLIEQIIARHHEMRLINASNGSNGIEIARSIHPDLVLMDINLPDMSGFKALEILHLDPATAHIPVIAISANDMPLNISSGLDAGFFRYLVKPINVDELMQAMRAALAMSERGRMVPDRRIPQS